MVETQSILAPGSVLPPGRLVATGELWAGNPAKMVRKLTKDEVSHTAGGQGYDRTCHQLSYSMLDSGGTLSDFLSKYIKFWNPISSNLIMMVLTMIPGQIGHECHFHRSKVGCWAIRAAVL